MWRWWLGAAFLPLMVMAQPERVRIGEGPGSFAIDRTEVTIADYAAYAARRLVQTAAERDGGGYEFSAGWQRRPGWHYKAPQGRPGAGNEPAVHLSWFEAKAYCEDTGGSLPTRAQWERAAYHELRDNPPPPLVFGTVYPYPTGETPGGANTVGGGDGWLHHAPVGATRPGVNGLYDMGANVWEWLADARGDDRLTAGGSWWYGPEQMRATAMQYKPAAFYAVYVGVRCVYP